MGSTQKTQLQTAVGVVSGIITYLLMLKFHSIPADVQAAIPAGVAVVLGYVAGFLKKEGPLVSKVEADIAAVEADVQKVLNVVNDLKAEQVQRAAKS